MCIREKHVFHNDVICNNVFHFKLLSNERLHFVNYLNKRSKGLTMQINFRLMQPHMIIFTDNILCRYFWPCLHVHLSLR